MNLSCFHLKPLTKGPRFQGEGKLADERLFSTGEAEKEIFNDLHNHLTEFSQLLNV